MAAAPVLRALGLLALLGNFGAARGQPAGDYYAKMGSALRTRARAAGSSEGEGTAALLRAMENKECVGELLQPASPYARGKTTRMVPRAYELLSRNYTMYRNPRIPRAFKAPCFKTCALVGSSGVLRGARWGDVIDKHEAVIRLNNAPTYGYERDVGKRTTMRIMHDVHLREKNIPEYLRMDRGGLIMMWPPQNKPRNMAGPPPNFGGKADKFATVKQLEQARAALLVTRMSLRAFKDSHLMAWRHVGPFPPYVPSTGWMSFYTALHVCRSLDVYGIGWSLAGESFKRARHRSVGKAYYFYKHTKGDVTENNYYFNREINDQRSFHGFDKEKEGMLEVSKIYNIKFH
eukprot:jgi/Tetstr1/431907/TSEL_021396.t1